MTLPPIFFYVIGTMLMVFGALRAVVLGRRRADREVTDEIVAVWPRCNGW